MAHDERSLLMLSRSESVDLLSQAGVGRVVYTEGAMPAVVPVTFAVHAGEIVMRTSAQTHLAAAAVRGDVLAFEVDDFDPVARTGSSVVIVGIPGIVVDPEALARIHLVLDPWPPGHHDICIRLPLTVVTGRRIAGSSPERVAVTVRAGSG